MTEIGSVSCNLADWASAIASFLAVCTALHIAHRQQKILDAARTQERLESAEKRHLLIDEAIKLIDEAIILTEQFSIPDSNFDQSLYRKDIIQKIRSVREQIIILQKFPMSEPGLFVEIGGVIFDLNCSLDITEMNISDQIDHFNNINRNLAKRKSIIIKLR